MLLLHHCFIAVIQMFFMKKASNPKGAEALFEEFHYTTEILFVH